MTCSRIRFAVASGLVLALHATCALSAPGPPLLARSLSARGPLALSFAAQPAASHWTFETGWPLGTHRGAGAAGAPAGDRTHFRLDALALASSDRDAAGGVRSGLATSVLLEADGATAARWLGVSFGGAHGGSGPVPRLRAAAGLVHAFSGVQAEAAVINSAVLFHADPRWTRTRTWQVPAPVETLGMRDTSDQVPTDHSVGWTTGQASLRWQRGRWALESIAGVSLGEGVGARRWAQGTVRVQVHRRLLLLASMGERPQASLAFDGAAHPHTMVGLQLAPWSTPQWEMARALVPRIIGWRTAGAGPGQVFVRVHCRDTHDVELAGDLTDWAPVRLVPMHANWWGAILPASSGPHRVQVRLDGGAWRAPAGLPRAADGPAGPAGELVVP